MKEKEAIMIRRSITLIAILACAAMASAQWQPCTPGTSVCQTSGNVGIGTSSPSEALDVNGTVKSNTFRVTGVAGDPYPFFASSNATTTGVALQLNGRFGDVPSSSFVGNYGGYGTYVSQNREPLPGTFLNGATAPNQYRAGQIVVADSIRGRLFQVTNFPGGSEAVRLLVDYNGNVGLGTLTPAERLDVNGNINVSGNINAKYQDVAEWVDAPAQFEPGTVVVLDRTHNNGVVASSSGYDTTAAGVISARPGISLGERSESKVLVATTGRVRVKVDASRGAIRIGDLLVTSDVAGTAMRSEAVEVAGVAMHRPGTVIGKALEPLDGGQGEILVLLTLQ